MASIDITGIVGTYAHLMATIYARSDTAATSTSVRMGFNGDSATNYDYEELFASAASPTAGEAFGQSAVIVAHMPAATAGANLFSATEVFIPHYAGASNNKQFVAINADKIGTTTGSVTVSIFGGGWRSNAAISRITLTPGAGNFVSGTRVTIHALGA